MPREIGRNIRDYSGSVIDVAPQFVLGREQTCRTSCFRARQQPGSAAVITPAQNYRS